MNMFNKALNYYLLFTVLFAQFVDSIITRTVKIATIIPNNNARLFSIDRVRPSIDFAMETVRNRSLLPEWLDLGVAYSDSHCNTKDAPVAAFNFYMEKSVDVFIGPVCDYSLAPVARYAPYWNIPVISPGGFAHDFGFNKLTYNDDPEFPTLTRVGATFNSLAHSIITIIQFYNWTRLKVIYDGDGRSEVTPRHCFLAGSALIYYIKMYNSHRNASFQSPIDSDFYLYMPGTHDVDQKLRREVGNSYSISLK